MSFGGFLVKAASHAIFLPTHPESSVCEFYAFSQSITHSVRTLSTAMLGHDRGYGFHVVSALRDAQSLTGAQRQFIKLREHRGVNVIEILCNSSVYIERGGELEKSKGRWALTWIMNLEEYLKRRRKECYTRHGKDTKSKRSVEMCLILIEVTFIVVLRKRGLGRGQFIGLL